MVNVIITSDSRYKINRDAVHNAVVEVLSQHKVTGDVEIEVSVVGDRKMHELNKQYRGIDATTDVLSFCLEDGGAGFIASPDKILRLGSIVISYPQAIEDASLDGKSIEDEVNFLVDHGTTHLLGIHHE
ncbi:MAG: rRNA maturation RNase YbeY [Microgenomates group bacterium]|jgi:probable rRNA maturation factor